ncbi:MAG: putative ABC transporter permease [Clostridia bacterium]
MNNTNIFAKGYSKYKYIWVFLIGCVFGYVYETLLCLAVNGVIENKQGLLIGPFAPVYGVGAIVYMYFLKNEKKAFNIFIYSTIIGGVVEFIYSFLQELYFGTVSWDYSEYFLNFQGRTSLLHALFWGILGVFFCKMIYPFISELIEKIPAKIGIVTSWIVVIFMSFDIYFSILVSLRQSERILGKAPQSVIEEAIDKYYTNEKLQNIYPGHIRKNKIGYNVSKN